MLVIKYCRSCRTVGMLAYQEQEIGYHALGGVTPEERGEKPMAAEYPETDEMTLVFRGDDPEPEVFPGWVHPDEVFAAELARLPGF